MDGMGDQFLAAACLSFNIDCGGGAGCTDNFMLHLQNFRAGTNDVIQWIDGCGMRLNHKKLLIQGFHQGYHIGRDGHGGVFTFGNHVYKTALDLTIMKQRSIGAVDRNFFIGTDIQKNCITRDEFLTFQDLIHSGIPNNVADITTLDLVQRIAGQRTPPVIDINVSPICICNNQPFQFSCDARHKCLGWDLIQFSDGHSIRSFS